MKNEFLTQRIINRSDKNKILSGILIKQFLRHYMIALNAE